MTTVLVEKLDKRVVADAEAGDSQRRATSRRGLRGLNIGRRVRLWQRQDHVSARPQGGWRRTGVVLLAVATALVVAAHARAEYGYNPPITTLVKNTDQPTERVVLLNAFQDGLYQGFRTGPNIGGYELTSILLYVHDTHRSRYMTIDAGIYLHDESGFTRVTDLIRGQLDDYAYNEWWAPENTYLEPDTDYYFLLDCTAGCANDNTAQFRTTYISENDPGAEEGWEIHDYLGFRSAGDPDWKGHSLYFLKIEIKGRPSFHRAYKTEIVSTPANGATYLYGESIDIALTFNTPVYVQGESYIGIQVGDVAGPSSRLAAYLSGSFTTRLVYRYQVQINDADANGISVDEGGPDTGFVGWVPTLVASFGLLPVDRYYPGVADDSSHKVDGSLHCTFLEDGSLHCIAGTAATLSVADARTTEETDATLEFAVTLSQAASEPVTVDYATADGTAQAGQDYTATDGTLTFAAGETQKTVSVAVLDDAHDEGEETLTLTLSNASGAHIADDMATGTIANDDPLQQAWLARFGRTAAQRVLDGVQARLRAPHEAGMHATVAGHDLSGAGEVVAQDRFEEQSEWGRSEATEVQFGPQLPTMRDLVTGSAFTLSSETVGGLGTLWGRGGYSGFDGSDNGLSLDGGMTTGMFGADYAIGRWVVGLPLSHSRGDGSWYSADRGAGRMASSLTGLYPYVGYELAERLSLWGTAGYGQGDLALMMQGGESHHTAMDLTMAAVGVRGDLVSARQAGGLSLAIESDALLVRTTSAAVSDPSGLLAAAVADVSRLRLGLEGSLDLALGGGLLTPTVELGLRHDGGDAETGFGVELGGGTVFADAARGLMAQVMVRGLVAHEAADFRDWRVSGSLRFDPTPSSELGPAVALTPSWGGASSGGVAALLGRETLAGLAANDAPASGRLGAEAAYGLAVFGGRAMGTPYLRVGQSEAFREVRMGCRLELLRWEGLEMGIEGTQRESTVDNMAPDREVMLHLALSAP